MGDYSSNGPYRGNSYSQRNYSNTTQQQPTVSADRVPNSNNPLTLTNTVVASSKYDEQNQMSAVDNGATSSTAGDWYLQQQQQAVVAAGYAQPPPPHTLYQQQHHYSAPQNSRPPNSHHYLGHHQQQRTAGHQQQQQAQTAAFHMPFHMPTAAVPSAQSQRFAATPAFLPAAAYLQFPATYPLSAYGPTGPSIPQQLLQNQAQAMQFAAGFRSPLLRNQLLQTSGRPHPQHKPYLQFTRDMQQNHHRHPLQSQLQQQHGGGFTVAPAVDNHLHMLPPSGVSAEDEALEHDGMYAYHHEQMQAQQQQAQMMGDVSGPIAVSSNSAIAGVTTTQEEESGDCFYEGPMAGGVDDASTLVSDAPAVVAADDGGRNEMSGSVVVFRSSSERHTDDGSSEMKSDCSEIPSPPRPSSPPMSPYTVADIRFGFVDDDGEQCPPTSEADGTRFWDEPSGTTVDDTDTPTDVDPIREQTVEETEVVLSPHANTTADSEPPHVDEGETTTAADVHSDTVSAVADVESESVAAELSSTSTPASIDGKVDDTSSADVKSESDMQPPVAAVPKTWASLFKGSAPLDKKPAAVAASDDGGTSRSMRSLVVSEKMTLSESSPKETTAISVGRSSSSSQLPPIDERQVVGVDADAKVPELLAMLTDETSMNHRGPTYLPRGLLNTANWCYTNATLQALIACPPFFHLLRRFSAAHIARRNPTCTPVLDSMAQFVNEFIPPTDKKGTDYIGPSDRPVYVGKPLNPTYMYSMATTLRTDHSFKGRQEDAEEFLLCLLNRLHEEMLAVVNSTEPREEFVDATESTATEPTMNGGLEIVDGETTTDEWQRVAHKKAPITRQTEFQHSPLSRIFVGELKFSLKKTGTKNTANVEPFFVLPVEIQDSEVRDVNSALMHALRKEHFKTTAAGNKTGKQEVNTQRSGHLQTLPPVLIIQLKYFVCSPDGSITKLDKPINYTADLTIDREILANPPVPLYSQRRKYKLFAVVFHHGGRTDGGHYTADVFHAGVWMRADDTQVELVPETHVTGAQPMRSPYLLFYRRCDLMNQLHPGVAPQPQPARSPPLRQTAHWSELLFDFIVFG